MVGDTSVDCCNVLGQYVETRKGAFLVDLSTRKKFKSRQNSEGDKYDADDARKANELGFDVLEHSVFIRLLNIGVLAFPFPFTSTS